LGDRLIFDSCLKKKKIELWKQEDKRFSPKSQNYRRKQELNTTRLAMMAITKKANGTHVSEYSGLYLS
jgi:hypothetical protein